MSTPTTAQYLGNTIGPAAYLIAKALESKQEFGEPSDAANDPWFVKAYDALKGERDFTSVFASEGDEGEEEEEAKKAGFSIWGIIQTVAFVLVILFLYVTHVDKNVLKKKGKNAPDYLFLIMWFLTSTMLLSPVWALLLLAVIPGPHFGLTKGYEIFPLEAVKEVAADTSISDAEKTLVNIVAKIPQLRGNTPQHVLNMNKLSTAAPAAAFGHFYY